MTSTKARINEDEVLAQVRTVRTRIRQAVLTLTAFAMFAACGGPTATGPDISGSYSLRSLNGGPGNSGIRLLVTRDGHWQTNDSGGTWVQADSSVEFLALAYGAGGYQGRRTATGLELSDAAGAQFVFEFIK